ncbi:putative bifunctional diguanylate cyclase/phosphodiesterase [Thioalkalivibrio paradoxus]|uniref:putative bifunctional diguanylate cyclase/phosphodiesterase n=1 Tax=Thioalkalivibrio paradoxus TaxID=108010 RepID=UPI00022C20F9|nr:EAL domain-containing protein [Thioalkalivibrio paradoxus]
MSQPIVTALLQNAALLLALVVVLTLLPRGLDSYQARVRVLMGFVLGVIGIGIMSTPFVLEPGIVFDTRSVLLAVSGVFFGALPTAIAMAIAAAYRLIQGGAGAWTGVSVIVASGLIGIAWAQLRRRPVAEIGAGELYLLGVVVHAVMLALMFTLPGPIAVDVVRAIGVPVAVIFPLATMALGMLLANRLRQRVATQALERSEARFRQLFENIDSIAVQIYDTRRRVLYWNHASEKLYGYTRSEALGRRLERLVVPPAMRPEVIARVSKWAREGFDSFSEELVLQRKDGTPVNVFSSHAMLRNPAGEPELYCIDIDVTRLRETEDRLRRSTEELEFQSQHDALTGLPNRLLLRDRLEVAMRRSGRRAGCVSALYIDLDRFKNLNDSLGHSLGDQLLQQVATRLQTHLRAGDTLARVGGDEFVLVLEGDDCKRHAGRVAGKLLGLLGTGLMVDGQQLFITASIGIALHPADGETVDQLLKNAELAMYRAKSQGRNTYCFYQEEMSREVMARLTLENALRLALAREEWVLHFQPQVHLATRRLTGVEALVRWQHPEQGLILPGRFIPIAEEMAIIGDLGAWVLRAACRQMQEWDALGCAVPRVAVNLSVQELERAALVPLVQEVLRETGLAPERLELEVTESMIMCEAGRAIETLRALQQLGVSVAVDDFGTGYSSLRYIKNLPLNRLKVDHAFVQDVGRSHDDDAIVRAIIGLGHSLDLEVVAEGVEREEQREFLQREGCEVGQGYLFGRPVPAEQIVARPLADGAR